jgi:hypothetical protein
MRALEWENAMKSIHYRVHLPPIRAVFSVNSLMGVLASTPARDGLHHTG